MANLPRIGRGWNRFSSIPRPASAAQLPTHEREQAVSDAEFPTSAALTNKTLHHFDNYPPSKVTSLPSSPVRESPRLRSPAKKFTSPPPHSSPKYSPPIKSARSPPSPTFKRHDNRRRISPNSSPKTAMPTKTSPPLSPLTLPRPAAGTFSRSPPHVEQKNVLYRPEKTLKSDRKPEYNSAKPTPKQQQAEAINITGHNVGAVMEIKQSTDKHEGVEIIRKKETESEKEKEMPMKAFMNTNFQSVNNSLMYDSSCDHRDPGLHLAFPGKTTKEDESSTVDDEKNYYKF